ncbi:MAG: AAA family ATPase [Betaproteobacteria bacterium]|nr:AAA family ATPase [Betaproteobacteria bacterium]
MHSDIERIREALHFTPASDREHWVRMAMAIKSELGDNGFDVWEGWSQQDDSFDTKAAQDVWKSIRAGGKVTIGTLFHEAKANGWRDDGMHQKPTPEVLAEQRRIAEERAAKEEAEIARERADTAKKAAAILKAATEAKADHPYLSRKRVSPVATLREIDAGKAAAILGYPPKSGGDLLTGRLLVVPVKQGDGLSTLELIDGDKRKAALAGRGSKVGGYWATERLPDGDGAGLTLLIGEGVATVLTGKEASGHTAIAALSAGNLPAVAKVMRERYPAAALVILADLVKATGEPDPHAIEAAKVGAGRAAIPDFGTDRDPDMTDMNDLFILDGAEAVERVIANAMAPARGEHQPGRENATAAILKGQENPPAGEYARDVNLIRASDVIPEPITWLWNGWLAAGKMHVFGGAPGTGKTTISMGLAATVTTGGRWPDGTRSIAGNVVIWSGEDDPADTLIPRLDLSGADLSRVYFISDIREGNERRSFDPARDMEPLRRKLAEIGGVRLLIVDPVVSAIAGDSHKNAEVRRGLQPLVDLAGAMRCALLGITHFSKGTGGRDPVERLTGSLAFGALARVVLVAAKHQEEGEDGRTVRLFCRAKSNIGPDGGGFEYDLHQAELKTHPGIFASSVLWGEAVEGGARELLATADATGDDGEGGTLADSKRFLADLLSDGPMRAGDVFKDADQAGYSKRSIQRAANAIKVERHKDGMKGGWTWRLLPKMPNTPEGAEGARTNYLAPTAPSAVSSPVEVEI